MSRISRILPLWSLLLAVPAAGCAGFATRAESASTWCRAVSAGGAALARGEPLEAARHYLLAERAARREKDRREARYRRARAMWRAGRTEAAARLLAALWHDGTVRGPRSVRAARAGLDLGLLYLSRGSLERALRVWGDLLARMPRAPLAATALERAVHTLRNTRGAAEALAWLDAHVRSTPAPSDLAEEALWLRGSLLAALGRTTAARSAWNALLRIVPPPRGRRWDEALWQLADLAERNGRLREAAGYLLRLANWHEPTQLIGSYTRARMPAAWLRAADLLARVGERERADALYLRFGARFPDSRLRDDALLAAARLWLASREVERACQRLRSAAQVRPGGAARRRAAELLARRCR